MDKLYLFISGLATGAAVGLVVVAVVVLSVQGWKLVRGYRKRDEEGVLYEDCQYSNHVSSQQESPHSLLSRE